MAYRYKTNTRLGFTLIELLIVIAIIGILVMVVFAAMQPGREKGRDGKRLQELHQFELALDLYYDKYGVYPCGDGSASEDLDGPVKNDGGTVDAPDGYHVGCNRVSPGPNDNGFLNGEGSVGTPGCVGPAQNVGLYTEGLIPLFCPKDPLNSTVGDAHMTYFYATNPARSGYILAAYLENNTALMASDGGVCSGVYEINHNLPAGYMVPWWIGKSFPWWTLPGPYSSVFSGPNPNGCPSFPYS